MSAEYILLVEDNPDDVTLTQVALQKCRVWQNLVVTRDGQEALDCLFKKGKFALPGHNQNPAIIILDLKLPYISGLEVLKQIRSNNRTSRIPVVILSSSINEKEMQESYKLGANNYFRKPVNFDQFKEIIQQIKSSWLDGDKNP